MTKARWGFEEFAVIAAVRYCLPRRDGMPSMCAEWLAENWAFFSDNTRSVVQHDVEHALSEAKAWKGHVPEMETWEKARALWTK